MSQKSVTIDELAGMVKRGFDDTSNNFGEVRKDIRELGERVENIEKLLLKQQNFKIHELEKRVRRMEDLLAMK